MKVALLSGALATAALAGCDPIRGVSRYAEVHAMPDLEGVKARIESYPEALQVELRQEQGGRPLTFSGIQAATEIFLLRYSDGASIQGTLQFNREYDGEVLYRQSLCRIGKPPPQAWIDSTWPIMMRVERDLAEDFGLSELRDSVKVQVWGVKHPEREQRTLP